VSKSVAIVDKKNSANCQSSDPVVGFNSWVGLIQLTNSNSSWKWSARQGITRAEIFTITKSASLSTETSPPTKRINYKYNTNTKSGILT
jgi:hypothetical protein